MIFCTFFPKFWLLHARDKAIGFCFIISDANPGPDKANNLFLFRNFSPIWVWNKQVSESIPLEQKTRGLFLKKV